MKHRVMSDEYPIFQFVFIRKQTRYKQINYQKIAYKVDNVEHVSELTLNDMLKIENSLKKIDYQTTRKKYKSKEQRKLNFPMRPRKNLLLWQELLGKYWICRKYVLPRMT